MPKISGALRLYADPRLRVILYLGFASGLPLALTASTLFTWLADIGVNIATIGVFSLVGAPYSLKFLWAPVIDGFAFPFLCARFGRRRGWLLATQCMLAAAMAAMALVSPRETPFLCGLVACSVAFFSASQDIVIDAYRVESIPLEEQGAAAAMYTLGYRIAMLVSGAGALVLSDNMSWHRVYFIMAGFMLVGILTTLKIPEPCALDETNPAQNWLKDSVIAPFSDFMTRDGWIAILAFIVLFKLADAYLGIMVNPFLLDIGFTKTQIAEIVKVYGLIATIGGTFMGGVLITKWGIYRTLMITSMCHIITNLLLVIQADLGTHSGFLALCIVSENLTAGMGSAAFIAYLSSLCHVRYTATQYALLSSLAAIARTMLSTASGKTAQALGWHGFFLFSSLLSIPALVLLWLIHKRWHTESHIVIPIKNDEKTKAYSHSPKEPV